MFIKPAFFRRTAIVTAALLASAVLSVARAAEPEVLTKVPGDAYAVVVINNVRTLSNRISNAATRLNLPLPPDLVGYLTRNLGIAKGFDANSSAALVLLKPPAGQPPEAYFSGQPPMVILLPTSDAKAMLEPFQPADADSAGISSVTLPQDPSQKGYVATVANKWVAFAQSHDDLAAYLGDTAAFSAQASPETRKVFDANDLVIWANVPKLSAGQDKAIDDFQTEITGMLELSNVTSNQDPLAGAVQKEVLTMMFSSVKELLKDTQSSMLTARLTDSGVTLGMVGDFIADSSVGKFVAAQKNAKPITFQGLPAVTGNNFLAAGGFNWDSASVAAKVGSAIDQFISNDAIVKDPRGADIKSYAELAKQLLANISGVRMVLLDPAAGGKNGYANGVALIDSADPQKFMALEEEMSKNTVVQQSMNPDFKQTTTFLPDAVTISGVKLGKLNIKFAMREETPDKPIIPANKTAFEAIQKVYGPDGLTAYIGAVGKQVLVVYGSDGPTLEAAVAAAKGNTDAFASNPAIAATKDQLVANPIAVSYMPITRWVTLAQSVMSPSPATDAPASPAIANAPSIVYSLGVTGSMLTAELHVPIATISGMQEAITRLTREMSGPQGGPAPSQMP